MNEDAIILAHMVHSLVVRASMASEEAVREAIARVEKEVVHASDDPDDKALLMAVDLLRVASDLDAKEARTRDALAAAKARLPADNTIPRFVGAIFRHDCEKCRFVGQDIPRGGETSEAGRIDMYVCEGQPLGGSLIRRCGDEGPAYSSMPWAVVLDGIKRGEPWMDSFLIVARAGGLL